MAKDSHKKIYKKCIRKGILPKHVCEIGVYLPQTSNILDFINDGVRTTLVEPDPKSLKAIKSFFTTNTNITLYPVAVFDYNGELELSQREASTFVSSLTASPALINDNYIPKEEDKFTVNCIKFNEIDDGTIDLLSVDTEGCEWYALKNLKSRPLVLSLETHGKYYTNTYIKDILNWIENNNYEVWYKDGSDTVFIKKGLFKVGIVEKLQLLFQELKIELVKLKRFVKKRRKK